MSGPVSCYSCEIILIFQLPMLVAFLALQCRASSFCFMYILGQKPGCCLREIYISLSLFISFSLSLECSCLRTTWNLVFEFEMKSSCYILRVKRPRTFSTVLGKYKREVAHSWKCQFKVTPIYYDSCSVRRLEFLFFPNDYLRTSVSSPTGEKLHLYSYIPLLPFVFYS
jgi:hypothetical protein